MNYFPLPPLALVFFDLGTASEGSKIMTRRANERVTANSPFIFLGSPSQYRGNKFCYGQVVKQQENFGSLDRFVGLLYSAKKAAWIQGFIGFVVHTFTAGDLKTEKAIHLFNERNFKSQLFSDCSDANSVAWSNKLTTLSILKVKYFFRVESKWFRQLMDWIEFTSN